MNTFQDLRQKLLELYKEAMEKYPELEHEEEVYNPVTHLTEKMVSTERENYIMDEIKNMDQDYRYNMLSLLALYYFMYVEYSKQDPDEEQTLDAETELYDEMKEKDVDDVIAEMLDDENSYLFDALTLVISEDIDTLEPSIFEKGIITDYEEYAVVDEVISDEENEEAINIYNEFHPNLELEERNHKDFLRNVRLSEELNSQVSAKSLSDFIEKIVIAKHLYTKERYFELFLYSLLVNTRNENKELFEKIFIYMTKYFYIKGQFKNAGNKDELEYIRLESLSAISALPEINLGIEKDFLDFEFNSMMQAYYALSDKQRDEMNYITSLDFRKTYGNEGRWNKYTPDQKETIYKYIYNWYSKIEDAENAGNLVYIYSSINENDCYCIPRLCVIVDKDDKIIDVLGRRDRINVEPEMLRTLGVFIKRFVNNEDVKVDIDILTNLKVIEDKINSHKELTKQEIDYLFEIECELPNKLLFHTDIYNRRIQDKISMKKAFATYFDCSEEEVAEKEEELNENTKVALFDLRIQGNVFPFPNMIAVYGSIYVNELTDSESLKNIRYVRNIISAQNLKEKDHIQEQLITKVEPTEQSKRRRK